MGREEEGKEVGKKSKLSQNCFLEAILSKQHHTSRLQARHKERKPAKDAETSAYTGFRAGKTLLLTSTYLLLCYYFHLANF